MSAERRSETAANPEPDDVADAMRAMSLLLNAARIDPILRDAAAKVDRYLHDLRVQVEDMEHQAEWLGRGLAQIAAYKGQNGLGYEEPKRLAQHTLDRAVFGRTPTAPNGSEGPST